MAWRRRFNAEEVPEYKEGARYTSRELDLMAEKLLREDARRERCRECEASYQSLEDVPFGTETGRYIDKGQYDKGGNPILDDAGNRLVIRYPEYKCPNNHTWYKGEGRAKGIGGRWPILFDEHMISRDRRRILSAEGVPDPSIVAGLYNRCVDEDTQALTKKGWKGPAELTCNDEIWAFDPKSQGCIWSPVLDLYIKEDFDDVIMVLESQNISARVTNGHRWIVKHENEGKNETLHEVITKIGYRPRAERDLRMIRMLSKHVYPFLVERHLIPLARPSIEDSAPLDSLRQARLELLGWMLADGASYREGEHDVTLTQSIHSSKLPRFLDCLRRNKVKTEYSYLDKNDVARWLIPAAIGRELRSIIPIKLFSQMRFYKLSFAERDALVKGMVYGDGSLRPMKGGAEQRCIFTTKEYEADAIQALCTLQGITSYKAHVGEKIFGEHKGNPYTFDEWHVNLKEARGAWAYVRPAIQEAQRYRGVIWCPSTTTGYWLARRNGKVYVTGNSHPGGRRINDPEKRKNSGASFFA
jgi:hypothetical protein